MSGLVKLPAVFGPRDVYVRPSAINVITVAGNVVVVVEGRGVVHERVFTSAHVSDAATAAKVVAELLDLIRSASC